MALSIFYETITLGALKNVLNLVSLSLYVSELLFYRRFRKLSKPLALKAVISRRLPTAFKSIWEKKMKNCLPYPASFIYSPTYFTLCRKQILKYGEIFLKSATWEIKHAFYLHRISWIVLIVLFMGIGQAETQEWPVEKATKEVMLRGYTRSIKRAVISAEVGGRVVQVNYEVGDSLSEIPFARLDSAFVDFDIQSTRLAISQLGIQIKQMDSRIAYLEKDDQRKESLFVKGRTTEVIRDAASQALDQARLDRKRLMTQQRALEVTLKRKQEEKSRHIISGPQGWVVTERRVERGEVIQAGSPLAVIQDFRNMVIPLSVSPDELQAIRSKAESAGRQNKKRLLKKSDLEKGVLKAGEPPADRFTMFLEGRRVMASIYTINPEFDEESRKINIQLRIHGYGETHRGGLQCLLPLTVSSQGLKIPIDAVQNRYENPKVFIKGSGASVSVTILDTVENGVIVAEDQRLFPGTLLTDQP